MFCFYDIDTYYDCFQVSSSLSPHFRPVVDGYFLPDAPEKLILSGDFDAKSVLIGSTRDEGLMAGITNKIPFNSIKNYIIRVIVNQQYVKIKYFHN